jgi:hypothetical protein
MAISEEKVWQYLEEGSGNTWRDSQVLESSATERSSSPLVELPDPRSHTSSSPATQSYLLFFVIPHALSGLLLYTERAFTKHLIACTSGENLITQRIYISR